MSSWDEEYVIKKKHYISFFFFRNMTVVRGLPVNRDFSIHYSSGLHMVSHGSVGRYTLTLHMKF